jgi:hypothetical protein
MFPEFSLDVPWDTLFGHANPHLRYPCEQVVFCVNLGAFFECFLLLGWGLTGVRFNSNRMFPEWSLNVP